MQVLMPSAMDDLLNAIEDEAENCYAYTRGEGFSYIMGGPIRKSMIPMYQQRAAALSKVARVMRGREPL